MGDGRKDPAVGWLLDPSAPYPILPLSIKLGPQHRGHKLQRGPSLPATNILTINPGGIDGGTPVVAQHEAVSNQCKRSVTACPSRGLGPEAPRDRGDMSPVRAGPGDTISFPDSLGTTAITLRWWRRPRGLRGPRLALLSVGIITGPPAAGSTINARLKYPAQDLQSLPA